MLITSSVSRKDLINKKYDNVKISTSNNTEETNDYYNDIADFLAFMFLEIEGK